jgi:hypothetical protein
MASRRCREQISFFSLCVSASLREAFLSRIRPQYTPTFPRANARSSALS